MIFVAQPEAKAISGRYQIVLVRLRNLDLVRRTTSAAQFRFVVLSRLRLAETTDQ